MPVLIGDWWRDTLVLESLGEVDVSTCRPWGNGPDNAQQPYYETCLFWGEVSLVVHQYGDAKQAKIGHGFWIDPESVARAIMANRRGDWEMCHTFPTN